MTSAGWLLAAAAAAGGAVLLLVGPAPAVRVGPVGRTLPVSTTEDPGWVRRGRWAWALLGAAAAWAFVGGTAGWLAGAATAVGVWRVASRAEAPGARRARARARTDLPHLVGLVADALRAGRPTGDALLQACRALPGPAADRVAVVLPRLRLGVDPGRVWSDLAADPDLGPLGRALGRAEESGAAAAVVLDRLAHDLAGAARADAEERARSVGVKAAVPLTLCLLPAFVLLGIVPVVAGLLATLGL